MLTPNPASSQLTAELTNESSNKNASINKVQLLNGDGDLIKESNLESRQIHLDIQGIPKSLYYVKVWVEREVSTTRILIE